jgi:hypothetical protein
MPAKAGISVGVRYGCCMRRGGWKITLIESNNPEWRDLASDVAHSD